MQITYLIRGEYLEYIMNSYNSIAKKPIGLKNEQRN